METEFQLLRKWLPRINTSVKDGHGIPKEFFRQIPRRKFNRKHICETFLVPPDKIPSTEESKIENIPGKREVLFNKIDRLRNSEYYYIILYYFLLKRSYEQEADKITEYISNKTSTIQTIGLLRQQAETLFNRVMKKIAKTDMELTEKVNRLKTTFLNQFDTEVGPYVPRVLTRNDIINKIDIAFRTYSEDSSSRERELLRLAETLSSKNILPKKPPHRPKDHTTDQLIVFMYKYFGTIKGMTHYKANNLIAEAINYCFFPEDPFNRDKVRQRHSDQWIKKGREKR